MFVQDPNLTRNPNLVSAPQPNGCTYAPMTVPCVYFTPVWNPYYTWWAQNNAPQAFWPNTTGPTFTNANTMPTQDNNPNVSTAHRANSPQDNTQHTVNTDPQTNHGVPNLNNPMPPFVPLMQHPMTWGGPYLLNYPCANPNMLNFQTIPAATPFTPNPWSVQTGYYYPICR